jgi:hypothetical protein
VTCACQDGCGREARQAASNNDYWQVRKRIPHHSTSPLLKIWVRVQESMVTRGSGCIDGERGSGKLRASLDLERMKEFCEQNEPSAAEVYCSSVLRERFRPFPHPSAVCWPSGITAC